MRKRFAKCNHLGKGAHCHRCEQANELMKRASILQASAAKATRKSLAESDETRRFVTFVGDGTMFVNGGVRAFSRTLGASPKAALEDISREMSAEAERLRGRDSGMPGIRPSLKPASET